MAKGKVELDLFSLAVCHICRKKATELVRGFFYCVKHAQVEKMGIDMPVKT